VEQIPTCSPWKGPHDGAGGCLKEAVMLWGACTGEAPARTCGHLEREAHVGAGLLAGLVTSMGDACWSSLFLKDCTHGKDPRWGSL